MADRFYCPGPWYDGRAVLEGDEARHLARVRRVEVGEVVLVFDGLGRSSSAEVVELGRDRASLLLIGDIADTHALPGPLILATAVPKGDRFDWLVEKATELGVTRLVPLVTDRSVVDPRPGKLGRLRRTIIEASKQSGRSRLMDLAEPCRWTDWLGLGPAGASFVAHPRSRRIGDGAPPFLERGIAVAIGPEGGFTEGEIREALDEGHRIIGLGPTILRIETAAVAACASVLTWAEMGRADDPERGRVG